MTWLGVAFEEGYSDGSAEDEERQTSKSEGSLWKQHGLCSVTGTRTHSSRIVRWEVTPCAGCRGKCFFPHLVFPFGGGCLPETCGHVPSSAHAVRARAWGLPQSWEAEWISLSHPGLQN